MNYKKVTWVLVIEALLCVVLTLLNPNMRGLYETVITFPFLPLAEGLRHLSLSGSAGNMGAWMIYSIAGLVPLLIWALRRRKRRIRSWDGLLWVMSGLIYATLYLLINPGLLSRYLTPSGLESMGAMILGSTFYAVVSGYIILTFMKKLIKAETRHLLAYLSMFLLGLAILTVAVVFSSTTQQMMTQLSSLRENNTADGIQFMTSDVFSVLRVMVKNLPNLLNIWIMYLGGRLIDALKENQYADQVIASATHLVKGCKTVISVTVISMILMNLSQLMFSKHLLNSDYHLMIPLMSMIFLLMLMVMTRFFADSCRLKNEVDSFI